MTKKIFCASIMTKMDFMLLVLMVTSCCCWRAVGSDEVLRKTNNSNSANSSNGDGMSQHNITTNAMFAEVNSVASSTTESQGALNSSKTDPVPPSATKETLDRVKEEDIGTHRKAKSYNIDKDISSLTSTSSTTTRPTRNGAPSLRSSSNRDTKLMNLLAARRNAMLQPGQFRTTHRRLTNRTSVESPFASSSLSSSKSPNATRSLCERNCTKNFTRRITANCIRRCLAQQKVSSTVTTNSQARTKVDEKDNNEILETDESSHGFFVIAKDLNDTANHIGDGVKSSEVSTEKIIRNGAKPTVSLENVDIAPYLFFGQKLPPLRPNRRLNHTYSEATSRQPTERGKNWNRNYQTRNFGSYGRFHGVKNVIRPTTTPAFTKPTSESSKERLVKDESIEAEPSESSEPPLRKEPVGINATETILLRNFTEEPKLIDAKEKTEDTANVKVEYIPTTRKATSTTAASSTTLASTSSTIATSSSTVTSTSPTESKTTSTSTMAPITASITSTSTTQPTISTTQKTTSFATLLPSSESTSTFKSSGTNASPNDSSITESPASPPKAASNTPTAEVNATQTTAAPPPPPPPPPPEEVANMFEAVNEDKPNLIIFYNVTTQPSTLSSPNVFTRTTISSSVRSTVNPKVRPPMETTSSVEYNLSSSTAESTTPSTVTVQHSSSDLNTVTPSVQDLSEATLVNGEVTIEMKRINTATYVLAGLGMFPIIIIILYVAKTIILKRRYKDDDDMDHFTCDGKPISPVRKMDHLDDDDSSDHYSIVTERDFDRQNLRFKSLLGEGNFGQVWKAEADDLIGHMGTTRIVAVKTVRSGSTQASLKEEAEIMRKLGSHPNVVTILGACLETEPHLLIMEYAMRGRLLSLLRAARSATNILPASVPGGRSLAPLSPRTLAGFALDIARGMEYISEKKIVHRDLAARNVLLDHNGVCKICDFGMSIDLEQSRHSPIQSKKSDNLQQRQCFDTRFQFDFGGRWMNHWNNNNNEKKQSHDSVSKRPALPIRWMAPEALQYHIFSIKTDVWAFGIVLWELATLGCTPYPNLSGREVIRNVPNGIRPELPQDGRPEFYDLMQRCWRKDPQLRPGFRDARNEISRISCKWHDDDMATSDYMDVSGFSEDLEHGMVYFNRRISEFECEI